MNKAEQLAIVSKKQFDKQCKKLYHKVYKGVHREIDLAVKKGSTYTYYHLPWALDEKYTTSVQFEVDRQIRSTLVKEGFYLRFYQLGAPTGPFEYTIAWGESIEKHINFDAIQENLMEERRREYAKNN